MTTERLEVLQMLADGKIDAAQAAAMLNGTASVEAPVADTESSDEEATEIEIDVDEDIVIEKSSKTDPPVIEKSVSKMIDDSADAGEAVEIIETKATHKNRDGSQKLRVTVSGKPIHANLNITVPVSLLKFGTHIGSYFEPEIDGADWETLDVEFMAGEQKIRLVVE